jgi:hypothetical protein
MVRVLRFFKLLLTRRAKPLESASRITRLEKDQLWIDGFIVDRETLRNGTNKTDVVIAPFPGTSQADAEQLARDINSAAPALAAAVASAQPTERTVTPDDVLTIVLWLRDNVALPAVVGVLSNYLFAKCHPAPADKKNVRVTFAIDTGRTTKRIDVHGTYDVVSKVLDDLRIGKRPNRLKA